MRKTSKTFSFTYPLKHKVVRDLKIVTEHVGDLQVEGQGYFHPGASPLDIFDRYSVDLEAVRWKGTDIREVLEVTGALDEITEAAIRYVAALFRDSLDRAA